MPGWKFEVGKDVVCRRPPRGWWGSPDEDIVGLTLPEAGGIYRVMSIEPERGDEPRWHGIIWLELAEFGAGMLFDSKWFEPVREVSIGVLTGLLAPSPVREDA